METSDFDPESDGYCEECMELIVFLDDNGNYCAACEKLYCQSCYSEKCTRVGDEYECKVHLRDKDDAFYKETFVCCLCKVKTAEDERKTCKQCGAGMPWCFCHIEVCIPKRCATCDPSFLLDETIDLKKSCGLQPFVFRKHENEWLVKLTKDTYPMRHRLARLGFQWMGDDKSWDKSFGSLEELKRCISNLK